MESEWDRKFKAVDGDGVFKLKTEACVLLKPKIAH